MLKKLQQLQLPIIQNILSADFLVEIYAPTTNKNQQQ